MLCPYCNSPLQEAAILTKSEQHGIVHECFTCGGHWFPRWLANDISVSQAITTDAITPQTKIAPPENPRCPECQTRLSLISHDSIPKGVHVYTCPQGHGNFFPKGELLQFKKAQESKITYHQLWGIPIKSIFAVLLPVAVVLTIAAGIPLTLSQLSTSKESRVAADEIISTPAVTQVPPDSITLSFTTSQPGSSTIILYQNNLKIRTIPVSSVPLSVHIVTIKDLSPNTHYTYTITLTTSTNTITSKHFPLNLTL